MVLKNTDSDTCFAYHCLCNVVGYCFLLFYSCPIYSLANTKDVAIYLECLCILELDVYTVDFAASRVVDLCIGPLLAFGVVFQTLYKDSYFGFYLVVFDGCACGKSITV